MKKIVFLSFVVLLTLKAAAQTSADVTETPITNKGLSATISGTLAMPKNASGKVPVVIIIADYGTTDRNGNDAQTGVNDNSYKLMAEGLGKNGIASLRFDKRIVGASTTSNKPNEMRYDDYVDDVVGLIGMLNNDQRFSKIIILGHGEGSMVGMLAARDQPVKGVISVNATSEQGDKFVTQQMKSKPQFMQDEFKTLLDSMKKGKTIDNIDLALYFIASPAKQPFLMSYFRYPPLRVIKIVKVPILIIQGTTDQEITVADAEKLKKAKSEAMLTIIPGMSHIMKDGPADKDQNLATYSKPDLPLKAELIPAIVNFVNKVD
ncbi:MAG TPA: alpha/beta hydrolase [Mucilaginibacter sp.]